MTGKKSGTLIGRRRRKRRQGKRCRTRGPIGSERKTQGGRHLRQHLQLQNYESQYLNNDANGQENIIFKLKQKPTFMFTSGVSRTHNKDYLLHS